MKKVKNRYLGASVFLALLVLFSSCDSTTLMWFHPQSYSDAINPAGTSAMYPDLAINEKGNILLAWIQEDGTNYMVYTREYRDGTWSSIPDLSKDAFSKTGQDASGVKVAMDDSGDAIVVWGQSDGLNTILFMREYRDGVWSSIPELDTGEFSPDGQTMTGFPRVAMSANGDAVVVWAQSNGTNSMIYLREYRNGSWSSKPDLLTDNFSETGQNVDSIDLAMDKNGNSIVVWQQGNGTNQMVYMREYRNGSWSPKPALLTGNFSASTQNAWIPRVAMDNRGNAIIVWLQDNGSGDNMIYKREYRDGSWSSIPYLAGGNISPTGQDAIYPAVAMSDKGNAIIAWVQNNGTTESIYKSEYKEGSWIHPVDLNDSFGPPTGSVLIRPEITMNSKGDAIIAYQMISGPLFSLLLSEYFGGSWSHPESTRDTITPSPGALPNLIPGYFTPLMMNGSGEAMIAWAGFDTLPVSSIFVSHRK